MTQGTFNLVTDEATDGVDTIARAAAQPWSSGQVGMFGKSYQALTQWLAAQEQPAALRAIAPMHAPFGDSTIHIYQGGAFRPAVILWVVVLHFAMDEVQRRIEQGRASEAELDALLEADQNIDALLAHLPMIDQPLIEGVAPYYFDILRDPEDQATKHAEAQHALYPRVTVPALIIGSWYDYFLPATLSHYEELKQHGGSATARRPHLIVGPWTHVDFPGMFAERDYGPHAGTRAIDFTSMHVRWFNRWLKDADNGVEHEKPMRIFVMGIDQWRDEDNWPLTDTQYRSYYLHSGGHANTSAGDGLLSTDAPGDEPANNYTLIRTIRFRASAARSCCQQRRPRSIPGRWISAESRNAMMCCAPQRRRCTTSARTG